MSVIIRLQNLPWSANALDIRQFFRGLSIPEGGVHIVGGEMGDAFIAFSTDEDARQAMMHDREAINGVQIRLLLSSRAEMQKVIEIARQQSLLALKKATGGAILAQPKSSPPIVVAPPSIQNTVVTTAPQPPVITASSFQNILTNTAATAVATPSFLAYQQQAGFTLIPEAKNTTTATKNNLDSDDSESKHDRDRRRSDSRDRRRSRSHSRERSIFRRRRERSRDRSRERDWTNGRRSSHLRSRSRERSRARSRERSRDRSRERERSRNNNSRDHNRRTSRDAGNINRPRSMDAMADNKPKSNLSPWSTTNAYQASYSSTDADQQSFMKIANYQATFNSSNNMGNDNKSMEATNIQNYNTANQSLTALNNYSLSGILNAGNSNDSFKGFALQNPYTTALNASANLTGNVSNTTSSSSIPGIFVEKKPLETNVTTAGNEPVLTQEPIAFANVNPYEQMYPTLFAQAAALSSGQKSLNTKQNSSTMSSMDSPKAEDTKPKEVDPNETNCIKISNMCSRTTYSDLRKFFVGLFIPHNGIKMLNDKHGLRVGIAYVQFSKQSSVAKALCRSKNLLKGKTLIIEAVDEQEFNEAEDSFRPPNQDKEYGHRGNESDDANDESGGNNNSGFSALNPYKKMIQLEPFTVLYIEDIPSLATEQDIMKMFSSYSLYDILLIASPENRREFVAYVRFSREEDAKSAYEDRAHHQIGYRRVRMRPSTIEEMENAKEKIRLANEQLMKEEQAAEEEEAKRKLEKLITEHIEKEESKQQNIVSMDLTQEDADDDNDRQVGEQDDDVIETTNELKNNNNTNDKDSVMNSRENYEREAENLRQNDIYSLQGNKFSSNLDPRRPQTPNIPSLFDLNPMNSTNLMQNQNRSNLFNDPRLRSMSERSTNSSVNSVDNNQQQNNPTMGGPNNYNNFNPNFNNQQQMNMTAGLNNMHNNFVILKNCEYNTRINDVAQLLLTANLALKHIEPLRNERQLPTGEFIVEFRRNNDAEIAVQRFHNIQFRNRSLRVFPITPQEIADRLGKPFLSYIPGGNGIRITKGMINDSLTRNLNNSNNNNNNNNRFRGNNNFNDNGPLNNDNDNNVNAPNNNNNNNGRSNNGGGGNGGGIPEQFTRQGCVLSLENVPYKAQLSDILNFFQGYDLTPDDIIRRYNDDGSPTGDARVAFMSPDQARSAFESRKRKKLFGRNIFIKII
ncbi:probable WRKY transcription factor protein 1 [Lucilia sericata]|uniref:probable WRKY transcription factor protein 1 n=1 Tax=Lucilia sericata TaxID=13632 RepID=UPI0018A8614C|nr:probable WRKY transcription factor protein 1 [Lucilia sericata]